MAKDFTKRRDEKVPSIDGIPTFFWHLVNKYVKDAWQVDGEEVILYEEFSVLRKHNVRGCTKTITLIRTSLTPPLGA